MVTLMIMHAVCWSCRAPMTVCPYCVNVVLVDPVRGLPPDVARVGGETRRISPAPESIARARREPVCDSCTARRPEPRPAAEVERHRSGYCRRD